MYPNGYKRWLSIQDAFTYLFIGSTYFIIDDIDYYPVGFQEENLGLA